MATPTQLQEFASDTTPAYDAGYNACYDGIPRAGHALSSLDEDWLLGWDDADREIRQEADCTFDPREEFDSGGWTAEDTRSMEAGPDIPLRNEAGEWMV